MLVQPLIFGLALTCIDLRGVTAASTTSCPTTTDTALPKAPSTIILDSSRLLNMAKKTRQMQLDSAQKKKFDAFIKIADSWLNKGPWSVTSKSFALPEGVTKHDYTSQAPYWWPANWENPSTGDRCPYIQRDGKRNEAEIKKFTDRQSSIDMMTSTYYLALAWWYTGKLQYRCKAGQILRTWFLDQQTQMTPHLEYAQAIPCKDKGRSYGIIDFAQQYTDVIDAVAILNTVTDNSWTAADQKAFTKWNVDFFNWLKDSKFGKDELKRPNNHALFATMQLATIGVFIGEEQFATTILTKRLQMINKFIDSDGSQPEELKRKGKSWHYSTFTLIAWTRMVCVGDLVKIDLWKGGRIAKAIQYLLPYAIGQGSTPEWPDKEEQMRRVSAYDIVHFAADRQLEGAQKALSKLDIPKEGDVWEFRPAVRQLGTGK